MAPTPHNREDFGIAVICALELEAECVHDVLDNVWDDKKYGKAPTDDNAYTLGAIGEHNVVLVHLPGMGTVRAAFAASNLKMSFANIKLALIVGVCGGMPYGTKGEEILLGDVIISKALIQYDFGKQYPQGFKRKTDIADILGPPSEKILALQAKLGTRQHRQELQNSTARFLEAIQQKSSQTKHPGMENDILYHPSYDHQHHSPIACDQCQQGNEICEVAVAMNCEDLGCSSSMRVGRKRLTNQSQSVIHFGIMGSANTVMKSGHHRDALAQNQGIIAVEMEGAGVWRHGPSIVIKGVCDYADSHKRKGWQRYAAATAAACMKAFLMEWTPDDTTIRLSAAPINSEETFSIVFGLSEAPETEGFVARQEELTLMHKTLSEGNGRRTVTLHGLGGIGKTQLAIAYMKDHRDDYSAIIWLNVKDEISVKQSFSRAARRILQEHPSSYQFCEISNDSKPDEVVAAVRRWLDHARNTRWLLVFDNYDNPKVANGDPGAVDILDFLPQAHHGSVIVTTRSSKVSMGRRIKVAKLQNIGDSLQILSNTSRREGVTDDPHATQLAKELDGLPLALATAGAYLDQVAISFADYLRLYKGSWLKLQQTSPNAISYENHTLYSTWQLSFDHIKGQSELSAKLLQLWAFFENEDLWFELLQHCDVEDPKWIQELTEDELSFHAAVRILTDYGLVEAHASKSSNESRGYSIHSCVHMWITFSLNQRSDYHLAKLALKFVGSHVPDEDDSMGWLTEQRLIHHAARCVHFVLNCGVSNDDMEWELHKLGVLYYNYGKVDEAEKIWQQALQGYEKSVTTDHPWFLDMFNHLGLLYTDQGKQDEAEKMHMRALQGRQETLGPEHPLTLKTLNNLGILYMEQGRLDEAEKMFQQSIEGYAKASGSDNMSVFCSMNNLGLLYESQGKLDKAETTLQLARQGYEKAYGPDHKSTFMTVMNLGFIYNRQRKSDEAERMYQRALQGYEKMLGPDHPSTLKAAKILGSFYEDHERLEEAEKMYQHALQGYEKILGPNHKSTLNIVYSLGVLYANQSRLDEAENMYQRTLQGYERAWGPDHKFTMDIVHNLGLLYKSQGKLDEAEKMFQRALEGKEIGRGPNHTLTLDTVHDLGSLYKDLGRLDEAEKMFLRALVGREKELGPDHPSTLDTVDSLGIVYTDLEQLHEAEKMFLRALVGYETTLGPDYSSTLCTANNLGLLYINLGRLDEAEKMFLRALVGREKELGPDHPSTLDTVDSLGIVYTDLEQLDEAEKMFLRALVGYETTLGPDHASTLCTANNLGLVYRDRCYIMWQESTVVSADTNPKSSVHTSFLRNKDALEKLYSKFPTTSLSDSQGRVYLWAGRESDAIAALRRHTDCSCDGCKIDLHTVSERFVCVNCRDCDLCSGCYEEYGGKGFVSGRLDCRHHRFVHIAVPNS